MIINYREIHGNDYGFPTWLMEKLDCPAAGEGAHSWMYRAFLSLRHYVEIDEAVEIVRENMTRRESPEGEVRRSAENAYKTEYHGLPSEAKYLGLPREAYQTPLLEDLRDPDAVERIYGNWKGKGTALQTLQAISYPIPVLTGILNRLYADKDWICVGAANFDDQGKMWGYTSHTVYKGWAVQNEPWCWAQIVPNPMRAKTGLTKEGKESERSKENAALHRKYAVTDFDFTLKGKFGPFIQRVMAELKLMQRYVIHEITARLILDIAVRDSRVPLLMVVDSGGKSLHAWWDIDALDYGRQREWFYQTVPLGTDPAIFESNNQFVRMPFGLREVTNVIQSVIFWGL
jgi:hypothetical protein